MSLPFIQPAVNAVKQWASFGVSEGQAEPHSGPIRKPKLSFDQQYPRLTSHLSLNDFQRSDLTLRLGFTTLGQNEIDLALSRTPADTEPSKVAATVSAVIYLWREEHPTDSDVAASRKMLEGNSSFAAVDGKIEAAKLALEQAQKEEADLDKAFHEFRSLPARAEQLQNKSASLRGQRKELVEIDFDAKITQLLELEYAPKVGTVIHGSVPALLMLKETLPLRLAVIDSLLEQCDQALKKLADDNKRLSKELDVPPHQL
jgi:hypothetical protein